MVLWQRYLKLINRPHQTPTRMARDEEVKIKGDGWPESSKSSETDTEKEQKNGPELPLLLLRSLRLWTAVCVWHGKAGRGGRDFRLEKRTEPRLGTAVTHLHSVRTDWHRQKKLPH